MVSLLVTLAGVELALRIHQRLSEPTFQPPEVALEGSRRARLRARAARPFSLWGLVQPSFFPDIVYELKPGLRGTFQDVPVEINGLGFRGPETSLAKPVGTYRIVGLGDSVMFGWGVRDGQSYLRVLEKLLNRRTRGRPPVEVLNLAVPGYNTTQEVETFARKGVHLEPDLVLIQFLPNDLSVPRFMTRPLSLFSPRYSLLAQRLGLRAWFRRGLEEGLLQRRDRLEAEASDASRRILDRYRHMVGLEAYRREMARLAMLCGERGIPVVVILQPDRVPLSRPAVDAARTHGFQLLNPEPALRRRLDRKGLDWSSFYSLSREDQHPNARAHRRIAESIRRKIVVEKLLPREPPEPASSKAPSERPRVEEAG